MSRHSIPELLRISMHGCRMIGVRTRENKIKDYHANFQWGVGFESDPEGFQM